MRHPYANLARVLGLLLATLVVGGALAVAADAVFPGWPAILRMAIPVEIALLAAISWAVTRTGRPWREALGVTPLPRRALLPLGLVLVGAVTVFSELYVLVQHVVPVPDSIEALLRELMQIHGPVDMLATVSVAVVAAPILEEALFRGVLLRQMAAGRGPTAAMVWTALFFALFHLHNPWQILPTFFLGLLLAWVVLTTGSLVASIVLHSAFNGVSLILFSVPLADTFGGGTVPWMVLGIVVLLLVGSAALLAGMIRLEDQTGGGRFGERLGEREPETTAAGGSPDPVRPSGSTIGRE